MTAVLVCVTDHAVERFRQRVSGGSGSLDVRPEITARVSRAWSEGRIEEGEARGTVHVADLDRRDVVYVCRWDKPRGELIVVTLWETGEDARVPRQFTDELRRLDRQARPPHRRRAPATE